MDKLILFAAINIPKIDLFDKSMKFSLFFEYMDKYSIEYSVNK